MVWFYHSYRCNFLNPNKTSRADREVRHYKLRTFIVPVATFNAGGVTCIQHAITLLHLPWRDGTIIIVLRSCEGEEREEYLLLMWDAVPWRPALETSELCMGMRKHSLRAS